MEKQITTEPCGHILTNVGAWSPDSRWIVYDRRSDALGERFDGTRIERVEVESGRVECLYESRNGACCGVATCSPVDDRVIFILGPEHPTPDWSYGAAHRRGVIVRASAPGETRPLDARDLVSPYTPGALRGGSHVHVFSGDGRWVSFTYEDHVLGQLASETGDHERNARNVGIAVPGPVTVPRTHPRNHPGDFFSVLITRTTASARPGSDDLLRAFEDAWVGVNGYVRSDGTRQKRAIAFQGEVLTPDGRRMSEVFIADLPDDPTTPGDGPLQGTPVTMPRPPRGVVCRRLTRTHDRAHPGIQGPRHWLRSSPDGSRIAFLMRDEAGIVQLWTLSPNGGPMRQVTRGPFDIASAFTWSPDGQWIACILDHSVARIHADTGQLQRLTERTAEPLLPLACIFSPDGQRIAYQRRVATSAGIFNQIFTVQVPAAAAVNAEAEKK